jgi:transposase
MVQKQPSAQSPKTMPSITVTHPCAAGIDIGSRSHWVAVPPGSAEQPVREFLGFTAELHALADWLKNCGVVTVAMESTGVYWIPLYDVLEQRGFEVLLVNAQHVRNVPGRKSDVLDCQWLQQLHTFGLLRGSFRPTEQYLEIRSYVRLRERIVQSAARCVQQMQKALTEMNLQVHHVLNDLTGVTGMAIVRDIVAGERDARKLAEHRDRRCKKSKAEITAALQGTFKPEHLFELEVALSSYDHQQAMLKACDERIERRLAELEKMACDEAVSQGRDLDPCPPPRTGSPKGNQPRFEIQSPLHRICHDVDLTQIPGIAPATALGLIAEIGTDMSKWRSAKAFASWVNAAPGTRITGGRRLSGRRLPRHNRAGAMLRQAAVAVGKMNNSLGACYRRLAARTHKVVALVATARKLAVLVYNALKHGMTYVEGSLEEYERRNNANQMRRLQRQAAALGCRLVPATPEPQAAAS